MDAAAHVIVGAGQTGANAAVAMREAGFAGPIVLIGDEVEAPYERPPLSKEAITDPDEPTPKWFHAPARYAALGIDLRLGVACTAIDHAARRVILADGHAVPYARLLLATGGRARTLSVPGAGRVLTLRTFADAVRLRAALVPGLRVVCIGAGVIGLETAASAHARGAIVTVLEAGPTVMGRSLTPDMAAWVARLHERAGITLRCDAVVTAITPDAVLCADGTEVPADLVIAGVGMIRDTALAEAAGLAMEGGAIVVDGWGRTSVPDIYAAGDVAAVPSARLDRRLRLENWRHAQDHGIAVGRAMAAPSGVTEAPHDDVPWFWSDQHGVNIQVAGMPEPTHRTVLRGDPEGRSFAAFHMDGAGRIQAATGVNAAREVRVAISLIRAGAKPDPGALADPAVKLQSLIPR